MFFLAGGSAKFGPPHNGPGSLTPADLAPEGHESSVYQTIGSQMARLPLYQQAEKLVSTAAPADNDD
jgi:hypothetical protein